LEFLYNLRRRVQALSCSSRFVGEAQQIFTAAGAEEGRVAMDATLVAASRWRVFGAASLLGWRTLLARA